MSSDKPDWAATGLEYDVFMRMEIMRLVMGFDDTIKRVYKLTREQEDIMNRILVWYMDRGTPQNVDSLANMVDRSWGKVRADLDKLRKLKVVVEVGNKLYPSSHFILGSDTSAVEVNSTIDRVARILKMKMDELENNDEHKQRQDTLAARLKEIRYLETHK